MTVPIAVILIVLAGVPAANDISAYSDETPRLTNVADRPVCSRPTDRFHAAMAQPVLVPVTAASDIGRSLVRKLGNTS